MKLSNNKKNKENSNKAEDKEEEKLEIIDTSSAKEKLRNLKRTISLRTLVLVLIIINILMFLFNFMLFMIPKKEITAVLEINPLTGSQNLRKIEGAIQELDRYTMPEYLILNTAKTYLTNLRSVSTDIYQTRENIKNVYAFSTGNAIKEAQDYFTQNNPIERYTKNKERVAVYIYNATPIDVISKEGEAKIQIDWQESVYSATNYIKDQKTYRAILDIKQYRATKQTSQVNPLGIYVTNIIVSEIKDGFIKQDI